VKDSNTGGEEPFVMLEPRQKVMPVPAASYARLAEYAVSVANGVTGEGPGGWPGGGRSRADVVEAERSEQISRVP